jgi:hypothetical protein
MKITAQTKIEISGNKAFKTSNKIFLKFKNKMKLRNEKNLKKALIIMMG